MYACIGKGNGNHASVLAWRIPGTGEPGGLPSLGSHRVGHNWGNLAAAAGGVCQPRWQISWELIGLEWLHSEACWLDSRQLGQWGDPGSLSLITLHTSFCLFPWQWFCSKGITGSTHQNIASDPLCWPEQVTNSAQNQRMGNASHLFMRGDSKSHSISHGYEGRRKSYSQFYNQSLVNSGVPK